MKKLFGGIDLTWKKLIIFAIATAIYTALMALIPITKDTSFRDISIYLEWWILFGIIIICNSKSPLDSALKCFAFFLISQPLIYLIQVPFSSMGFGLFRYYRYWFLWTLCTFPMGFIGYYIKKKNILSVFILLPMLCLLAYFGLGYFSSVIDNFPHHLLSFVACFAMIIIIVLNVFDKTIFRIISIASVLFISSIYIIFAGGVINQEFETYRTLDDYNITFEGKIYISFYSGTSKGFVEVVSSTDEIHSVKVNGRKRGKYKFDISDDSENTYSFEYYYDKDENTVILKRID